MDYKEYSDDEIRLKLEEYNNDKNIPKQYKNLAAFYKYLKGELDIDNHEVSDFSSEVKSLKVFEYKGYTCEVKFNDYTKNYLGYFFILKNHKLYNCSLSELIKIVNAPNDLDDDVIENDIRRIGFIFRSWLSDLKLHKQIEENADFAIEKVSNEIKLIIDQLEDL